MNWKEFFKLSGWKATLFVIFIIILFSLFLISGCFCPREITCEEGHKWHCGSFLVWGLKCRAGCFPNDLITLYQTIDWLFYLVTFFISYLISCTIAYFCNKVKKK